jgi:hypothetical protein
MSINRGSPRWRDQDAVGGADDRAGEGREFLLLFLPGAAGVPGRVRMPAELGVHVGRQHLPVRIYFDVGTLELPEQVPEVEQVMPGDEDPGSDLGTLLDPHRLRPAERLHVPGVQQLHDPKIHQRLPLDGPRRTAMHVDVFVLPPLIALLAGIAILVWPRLLNFIVAGYLILVGLIGLGVRF